MKMRLVRHHGGLKVYADRAAMAEIARELIRLSTAPEGEHYEFQTLEWEGVPGADVKAYDGGEFASMADLRQFETEGFDLNFITLEETDFESFPET